MNQSHIASRRARYRRTLVAFLFHAPGLWLVGEKLPPRLLVPNTAALLVTIAVAVSCGNWRHALLAWAIGHVAWGVYLARLVWAAETRD